MKREKLEKLSDREGEKINRNDVKLIRTIKMKKMKTAHLRKTS